MNIENNIAVAKALLEGLASAGNPAKVTALFAENVSFEIQGDVGVLPWVGYKAGRQAVVDFMHDRDSLMEPLAFDVEDILASDARAVTVGSLRSRIKATGNIASTQFTIVLTIANGVIARFQMLEDSFGVSKAACNG